MRAKDENARLARGIVCALMAFNFLAAIVLDLMGCLHMDDLFWPLNWVAGCLAVTVFEFTFLVLAFFCLSPFLAVVWIGRLLVADCKAWAGK